MKTKLVLISGNLIGIFGMDELFQGLYQAGKTPDEELGKLILEKLKKNNYIPERVEQNYTDAFLHEYRKFCEQKNSGQANNEETRGTWQGIPREEIPWFPVINEGLCNGCQICLKFCPFGVYEWDEKVDVVRVSNPFNCYVGCSTCASKCKPGAINFPPREMLNNLGIRA